MKRGNLSDSFQHTKQTLWPVHKGPEESSRILESQYQKFKSGQEASLSAGKTNSSATPEIHLRVRLNTTTMSDEPVTTNPRQRKPTTVEDGRYMLPRHNPSAADLIKDEIRRAMEEAEARERKMLGRPIVFCILFSGVLLCLNWWMGFGWVAGLMALACFLACMFACNLVANKVVLWVLEAQVPSP